MTIAAVLFASREEAFRAAQEWAATRRKDWDVEGPVLIDSFSPGLLALAHLVSPEAGPYRAGKQERETVEGFVSLGIPLPRQWRGEPLSAFRVDAEGPFARAGEDWRGTSSAVFLAAFPAE